MISAVSGNSSAALLSLFGGPRQADRSNSATMAQPAASAPPPPGNSSGANAQSLFQALLGSGDTAFSTDRTKDNLLSDLLSKLDGDGDGAISRDELISAASPSQTSSAAQTAGANPQQDLLSGIMASLDANGDGKLSLDEMKAAFGRVQGNGQTDSATASATAGSTAPKSIYQSVFEVLATTAGSAQSASQRNDVAYKFLSALTN